MKTVVYLWGEMAGPVIVLQSCKIENFMCLVIESLLQNVYCFQKNKMFNHLKPTAVNIEVCQWYTEIMSKMIGSCTAVVLRFHLIA